MARDLESSKPQTSGWHIALDAADAPDEIVYLGDADAVKAMVAQFNSEVIDRQKAIAERRMGADQAVAADQELSFRMADILLGKGGPMWRPMGEWNSPASGIAAHFGMIYHIETDGYDPRDVIAEAWGRHLRSLYGATRSAMQGRPDAEWQADIDRANDLMAAAILGLHWPGAYEGEEHPAEQLA